MFKNLFARNIITYLPYGRCLATITEHVSTIIMVEIVLNVGGSSLELQFRYQASATAVKPSSKTYIVANNLILYTGNMCGNIKILRQAVTNLSTSATFTNYI